MTQDEAQAIIEYNKSVYAAIAHEFEQTRRALHWPVLAEFAGRVSDGELVLDVGCGSGRSLNYLKDKQVEYVGMDNVEELLREAKGNFKGENKGVVVTWCLGNILSIPFPDQSFDHVFAIAVLHHIPSHELRVQALNEIVRVLKPGGALFMTNWNLWKGKNRVHILRTWLKKIKLYAGSQSVPVFHDRVISGQSAEASVFEINSECRFIPPQLLKALEWNDVLIPWQNTYWRYYHAFTKGEMKHLIEDSGLTLEYLDTDGSSRVYEGKHWNWITEARLGTGR